MECQNPIHPTGFDVTRAEGIWDSVTAFHEALDDLGEWSGGVTVRTMVESNRGPFVVLTAFLKDAALWRVDRTTSLNATTHWWLRLHGNPHPFPNEKSPRSAAMSFWYHVQMHSPRHAMDFVVPDSRQLEIPKIGTGEVWEFLLSRPERGCGAGDGPRADQHGGAGADCPNAAGVAGRRMAGRSCAGAGAIARSRRGVGEAYLYYGRQLGS